MFETGYFIEKNDLPDPELPVIIMIVFLLYYGFTTPNKALDIIKLVSKFFFSIKEFIV